LPELRTLRLISVYISEFEMSQLLLKHRNTLERVELRDSGLDGNWETLLLRMKSGLSKLRTVVIDTCTDNPVPGPLEFPPELHTPGPSAYAFRCNPGDGKAVFPITISPESWVK